jgi:hypothetical protein
MLNRPEADMGVSPAVDLCDMLPQWPSWIDALAPVSWMASVMLRRAGIICGRIHSWRGNERPLRVTEA